MSAISMTPEVVTAVNELLEENNVDSIIVKLQNAEETFQKTAYEDLTGESDYMFRYAYDLRLIREEFEKLEELLGYEPKRD